VATIPPIRRPLPAVCPEALRPTVITRTAFKRLTAETLQTYTQCMILSYYLNYLTYTLYSGVMSDLHPGMCMHTHHVYVKYNTNWKHLIPVQYTRTHFY
jgi:hypothetical protein